MENNTLASTNRKMSQAKLIAVCEESDALLLAS